MGFSKVLDGRFYPNTHLCQYNQHRVEFQLFRWSCPLQLMLHWTVHQPWTKQKSKQRNIITPSVCFKLFKINNNQKLLKLKLNITFRIWNPRLTFCENCFAILSFQSAKDEWVALSQNNSQLIFCSPTLFTLTKLLLKKDLN